MIFYDPSDHQKRRIILTLFTVIVANQLEQIIATPSLQLSIKSGEQKQQRHLIYTKTSSLSDLNLNEHNYDSDYFDDNNNNPDYDYFSSNQSPRFYDSM
jgi:hypothetical protein